MYRIRTLFTGSPVSDGLSTVHFDASASTPGAAHAALANFFGSIDSHFQSFQEITISGEIDLIDEATGDLIDTASVGDIGVNTTNIAAALPPATQLLVRLSTPTVVHGRRLKGRMFIPGFTEDDNTNGGQVTSDLFDDAGSAIGVLIEDPGTSLCIWHRPNTDGPGSKSAVTAASIAQQWSVLRQRRPGH